MTDGKAGSVLVPVPSHQVTRTWPAVEGLIEKALRRGSSHWTALDIYSQLLLDRMHLWLSKREARVEACGVTQIVLYPGAKVMSLLVLSGENREHWLRFEAEIEAWARANGCKAMEGCGRKGWIKAAPEGWEFVHAIVRKNL